MVLEKNSQFRPTDMNMLREFYKASLLERFTKVDFIRQEVVEMKGKEFLVFEFVSTVADERNGSMMAPVQKYSIIQYTIVENDPKTVRDNQLISFTFHAPFSMKNNWQDPARTMMASVNIKKK